MLSTKNRTSWPFVAEVFGDRQTGQSDASAGARRFVHLAVDEGCLGAFAAAMLVDAGFDHFVIEVVAFAGTFTDACEHRVTTVRLGDVVDQFHDENGLADAGAAEQADLAALGVRREQVDDLDAGDENLCFGRLLDVSRRVLVDGALAWSDQRTGFVNRLADDVHDAAERFRTDRNGDRSAGVGDLLTANQTFGRVHGDGADSVFAEVLGNFENETVAVVVGFQRVQNRRQFAFFESNVDDGADDLRHATDCTRRCDDCGCLHSRRLAGCCRLLSRCGICG